MQCYAIANFRKFLSAIVLGMLLVGLGTYQFTHLWLAQDVAAPGSLFASLPALSDGRPQAWLLRFCGWPSERRFLARLAVAHLDQRSSAASLGRAEALVAALPPGHEQAALQAQLALSRGDHNQAFSAALFAGDMQIVNQEVARYAQHHLASAIVLQEQVIRQLAGREQRESQADAYWRLGVLENRAALLGQAHVHRVRAQRAFEENVLLTPLSGRALLSAGYAALALGQRRLAQQRFAQALAADPASIEARLGLEHAR